MTFVRRATPFWAYCTKASFSPNSTYSLYLQLGQVPKFPDWAIFVSMMTITMTMTWPITLPFAHARGVTKLLSYRKRTIYTYTVHLSHLVAGFSHYTLLGLLYGQETSITHSLTNVLVLRFIVEGEGSSNSCSISPHTSVYPLWLMVDVLGTGRK